MKILHVAETAKGGVGSVISDLISNSVNKEHFILIPESHAKYFVTEVNKYVFKRSGRNIPSFLSLAYVFIKIFYDIKPDIVHLHSTYAGVIIRLMSLFIPPIRSSKIIYTPHAFPFLMTRQSSIVKRISILLEKFLSKVTNKIVCNSHYEMEMGLSYGIKEEKLTVIYNGVSVKNSEYNKGNPQHSHDKSKIKVLFVGRYDYQKGYDILLEIIDKVGKNISFDLIGDAVNDKVQYSTQSNITYHGWLPKERIQEFYKNATFLIMPSRWESFGLVAVEAQSFGLPVLANNVCSLPEVINPEVTGLLVDFRNIDKVVELIECTDKQYWSRMKDECIKFSSEKFSLDMMIQRYESLYIAILRN